MGVKNGFKPKRVVRGARRLLLQTPANRASLKEHSVNETGTQRNRHVPTQTATIAGACTRGQEIASPLGDGSDDRRLCLGQKSACSMGVGLLTSGTSASCAHSSPARCRAQRDATGGSAPPPSACRNPRPPRKSLSQSGVCNPRLAARGARRA